MAKPIRVLAAGSLRHALPEIAAVFEQTTGTPVSLSLGPAGLLRERIEAGEPFDLFASANMVHPERLVSLGLAKEAICFTRNRLCILARASLGLTAENLVETLASPAIRIGTSTPGDDPSGDYAVEMFDLVERLHPGLGRDLKHRTRQLLGGRHSPSGKSAAGLIGEGVVDLFVGYASNARLHDKDPSLSIVQLPSGLSPAIAYGMAASGTSDKSAATLRDFLLTPRAKAILLANGFFPI